MNPVNSKAKHLDFFSSNLINTLQSTYLQTTGCVFSSRTLLNKTWKGSLFICRAFLFKKKKKTYSSERFWTNETIEIPFPAIVWLALDLLFLLSIIEPQFVHTATIWKRESGFCSQAHASYSLKKCCSLSPPIIQTNTASVPTYTAFICSRNWNHKRQRAKKKCEKRNQSTSTHWNG